MRFFHNDIATPRNMASSISHAGSHSLSDSATCPSRDATVPVAICSQFILETVACLLFLVFGPQTHPSTRVTSPNSERVVQHEHTLGNGSTPASLKSCFSSAAVVKSQSTVM